MHIILYDNLSKDNAVHKDLSEITSFEIQANEDFDILRPSIIINAGYSFNYVFIATFERYYFVTGVEKLDGNRQKVNLEVDVLMSHSDILLRSLLFVERSSNNVSYYYDDQQVPLDCKSWVQTKINSYRSPIFGSDVATANGQFYVGMFAGSNV